MDEFVNGLTNMLPGALVALVAVFYGLLALDILFHAVAYFFNAWRYRRAFRRTVARMSYADYTNARKGDSQ